MAGDITARGGAYAVVVESLSHAPWSMTHSHIRALSTNWEKKSAETMANPLIQGEH